MGKFKIKTWKEKWLKDEFYYVLFLDETNNFIAKGIIEYKGIYRNSYCSLYHVYVDENYRGKGYFRKIINECLEHIKQSGCKTVGLYAIPELMKVYEQYGFEFNGDINNDGEYAGYLEIKEMYEV
jgi:GNAT superfamily N-acetyltransferase